MAKGENIFKRKDGRWEARYIKGYELSGKIKYGFCYTNLTNREISGDGNLPLLGVVHCKCSRKSPKNLLN